MAAAGVAFVAAMAPERQAEADATSQATADTIVPRAEAQQAQANGDAAAAADFRIAQANETATVWNWLAGQLGGPWAQSQAGLAGAEAGWAATAAANYKQYVAALGVDMVQYATSDSDQFVSEMSTIDATDCADSDKLADAQMTLTTNLASDEATFEQTLAQASGTYQEGMGQASHDYRWAVAQATHDLIVTGDAAAYTAAMAAASEARTAAQNQAVSGFETTVDPAVSQQASGDADATLAEAKAAADATLDDALVGDKAVHDYVYAEAADMDAKQKADAQAL